MIHNTRLSENVDFIGALHENETFGMQYSTCNDKLEFLGNFLAKKGRTADPFFRDRVLLTPTDVRHCGAIEFSYHPASAGHWPLANSRRYFGTRKRSSGSGRFQGSKKEVERTAP